MIAWIEVLLIAAGCVYFALCRKKASFYAVLVYLCLFVMFRPSVGVDLFLTHWSSPFHIILSWGTKVWMLCLGTSIVMSGVRPEPWKIQTGIWLSAASIITGIFWAFDAPNWGFLWQWDGIETLSLCAFFVLYGLKNSRDFLFSGYACLVMISLQNIALYGTGMTGDISRHSYAEVSSHAMILTALQIFWFVAVAVIGRFRRKKVAVKSDDVTAQRPGNGMVWLSAMIALMGIAICVMTGILPAVTTSLMAFVYYGAFAVSWACLSNWRNRVGRVVAICGLATICFPGVVSFDSETELAEIGNRESHAELIGIRAESLEERIHYTAEIRYGSELADIEMDSYGNEFYPTDHVDVFSGGFVRLWGLDYKANRGVNLLVRNITLERLYEVWLIALLVLSSVVFVFEKRSRHKLKASEQGSGDNERPGR